MQPVDFNNYGFEVIESDIKSKQAHVIAITYFTGQLLLHQIIGNFLLLSGLKEEGNNNPVTETFMVEMKAPLSINTYQPLLIKTTFKLIPNLNGIIPHIRGMVFVL